MDLTDAQWAALAPLVKRCRLRGKTSAHDLRRTIEAIVWRCANGAKWRAIPAELGTSGTTSVVPAFSGTDDRRCRSWWRAAQTFIRWARLGPERLLDAAQEHGVALGMALLDGTSVRAQQKAAGAARNGDFERSGTCMRRLADLAAAMAP